MSAERRQRGAALKVGSFLQQCRLGNPKRPSERASRDLTTPKQLIPKQDTWTHQQQQQLQAISYVYASNRTQVKKTQLVIICVQYVNIVQRKCPPSIHVCVYRDAYCGAVIINNSSCSENNRSVWKWCRTSRW